MRLVVSTTDQGYALPAEAAVYSVGLAGDGAGARGARGGRPDAGRRRLLALVGAARRARRARRCSAGPRPSCWGRRRRRRVSAVEPDGEDVPLRFEGVTKAYKDGFVAVRDLSFEVRRGQVLGLLGPNGAGKTTSLRMLMGLIRPDRGADQRLRARGRARAPRCCPGSARSSRAPASCRTCPAGTT